MVTGFTKFDFEEFSRKDIQQTIDDYKKYKKWFKFPAGLKGKSLMFVVKYFSNIFQIINGKTSWGM